MRMREYCGEYPPPIMTTNQSRVFITFQTDSLINRRGFTVFYAYTGKKTLHFLEIKAGYMLYTLKL